MTWGWSDWVLLALLMVFGFFWLRTTPEFAANLPQDAADFAISAVNLLTEGRLGVTMYGSPQPTGRTIGLPLLLVPSYWVSGSFVGNGIYSILVLALLTVGCVYYSARLLAGRLAAVVAALFLLAHHGFRLYSQKIMSEVPAMGLVSLMLALTVYLHWQRDRIWPYAALGISWGLAIVIRSENLLLVFPLLGLAAFRLLRLDWRRGLLVGLCALPWLVGQAMYNHHNYGSFRRSAYHWIGWFEKPSFALHNVTATGYWVKTRGYPPEMAARMDGNLPFVLKTCASQIDNSMIFSRLTNWRASGQAFYATLVSLRTVIGLVGIGVCCWLWKRRPQVRLFVMWLAGLGITTLVFYALFSWQEERYLLRLLPLLVIANGIGAAHVAGLLRRVLPLGPQGSTFLVGGFVGALLLGVSLMSALHLVYRGDDNLLLYRTMRSVAQAIPSNAVVITNWDPLRVDEHIAKGTSRVILPLVGDWLRWPRDNATPVPTFPFVPLQEPSRLLDLLKGGRKACLLLRNPFDFAPPPPEIALFGEHFALRPIANYSTPQGQVIGTYLYELVPKISQ